MNKNHYRSLLIMAVLSFISMYLLMYAMVDVFDNVYSNFNQFYMAGLMTAPMVVIELLLMGGMYPNKRANAAISDRQFLKSMIPHHASAILMCERAPLHDAEIKALCKGIIAGQQAEIDQMKARLSQLER